MNQYQQIEQAIISWSNDGTQTAGTLTRKIMDIIENKHQLNEYGLLVFRSKKEPNIFMQRSYYWKDRVLMLDESKNRLVVGGGKFSEMDLTDWEPMTEEQYALVEQNYLDAYKD